MERFDTVHRLQCTTSIRATKPGQSSPTLAHIAGQGVARAAQCSPASSAFVSSPEFPEQIKAACHGMEKKQQDINKKTPHTHKIKTKTTDCFQAQKYSSLTVA